MYALEGSKAKNQGRGHPLLCLRICALHVAVSDALESRGQSMGMVETSEHLTLELGSSHSRRQNPEDFSCNQASTTR